VIDFTPRAQEILARTHQAARRFSPDSLVRASRSADGVTFSLVDRPEPGDLKIDGEGFVLLVEAGLEGTVDVVEPHDQLVLRPPA
jgi:hypothetical protein